jgi:uncharacterized integral membrane protein (TIGR00697 family)
MSRSIKLYIFLCSLFCTIVITGNLIFQKFIIVNILSLEFELSVGVLLYPITFLISDLTAEFYGNKYTNHMIKISVLCSFIVMGLIMIGDYFPATSWSNIDDYSFHEMFSGYGIASFASIIASFFAQLLDVKIYTYLKSLTKSKHLWLRNNLSTILAQLLDTILVVTIICFADILSWDNYYKIALNSILFKVIAALADTPFCYLGYYLIKKFLAKDEESLKKIIQ